MLFRTQRRTSSWQVKKQQKCSRISSCLLFKVSGAASCRTCSRKIKQGTVRVQYNGGKFVHLRCWKGPAMLVKENYFRTNSLLSAEQQEQLDNWVVKHNAAQKHKAPEAAPIERTFSVSAVAAAPVQGNAGEAVRRVFLFFSVCCVFDLVF
jgi:hypothetical protein